MSRINVTRSSMPEFDEYVEAIRPLWDSRWLSNRGSISIAFEEALKDYMKVERLSLFANGHVAQEVMIDAFNLPEGGEVITTPYTHVSTTHCIVRNGLVPVFCDVSEDNYTIDPEKIEDLINDKTVAIMGTHVYGELCDVKKIKEIADAHGLKVFYDAAHAFGETLDGVGVGNYGDFAMFSCHATKVFHTIEGGIATVNDESVFPALESMINFGFDGPERVQYVSTNARMNEFESAMGICNLRHIDEEIAKRAAVEERYRANLEGIHGIRFIKPQEGIKYNHSYMPVFFDDYKESRNQIQLKLANEDIFARKYFYPLTSEMDCYHGQYTASVVQTPVAKWAAEHVLTLPMYADLSLEDVDRICGIILK